MLTIVKRSRFQMIGRFLADSLPVNAQRWGTVTVQIAAWQASQPFATLNFEWMDQEQGICRVWADDTSNWPVGRAKMQCALSNTFGDPYFSEPEYLRIIDSVVNR